MKKQVELPCIRAIAALSAEPKTFTITEPSREPVEVTVARAKVVVPVILDTQLGTIYAQDGTVITLEELARRLRQATQSGSNCRNDGADDVYFIFNGTASTVTIDDGYFAITVGAFQKLCVRYDVVRDTESLYWGIPHKTLHDLVQWAVWHKRIPQGMPCARPAQRSG